MFGQPPQFHRTLCDVTSILRYFFFLINFSFSIVVFYYPFLNFPTAITSHSVFDSFLLLLTVLQETAKYCEFFITSFYTQAYTYLNWTVIPFLMNNDALLCLKFILLFLNCQLNFVSIFLNLVRMPTAYQFGECCCSF